MKRLLLSLAFMGAVLLGNAQVILNEFYTDASVNSTPTNPVVAKQFFEIYNSGNSEVDLNCFSIVSLSINNKGEVQYFNFIDLPNVKLAAKSYFTASAANQTRYNGVDYTVNYNWNTATDGASFKKYTPQGGGYKIDNAAGDFFVTNNGNTKIAVFLFDGNNPSLNSSGIPIAKYSNGFVAYGNNPTVAIQSSFAFSTRPPFINPTPSCASYNIDWSIVTTSEFADAAGGNGHGYFRAGNGQCGTWAKAPNDADFTPNTKNKIRAINVPASGALNTIENILCDGTQIAFKILQTPDVQFPITVELYYDDNDDDYLDADEIQGSIGNITSLPYSGSFNITPGKEVFLVYKTNLGCASKIAAGIPAVNGPVATTQTMYCGKQIDFRLPVSENSANSLALPIEVRLYQDNDNTPGQFDFDTAGATVGTQGLLYMKVVNSYSDLYTTIQIPDGSQEKSYILVYKSAYSCFSKSVLSSQITPANQTIVTKEENFDRKTGSSYVTFDVTEVSANVSAVDFPITVKLFVDENDSRVFDADDVEVSTTNPLKIENVNDGKQTVTLETTEEFIIFQYYSNRGCLLYETILGPTLEVTLPVKFASFTAARNKANKQQVELTWTTAQEQNNKGFYIQRKTGNEWKDVAFVFSAAEGGNSSEALTYRFKDANTHPGVSQYRLLQVDLDGKATYSNIVSLMGETPKSSVVIYPNPAVGGNVNLVFADAEAAKQVLVSDLSGRVVQQYRNITTASHAISGLKTGFYTIKVTNTKTGETVVEKMIVP